MKDVEKTSSDIVIVNNNKKTLTYQIDDESLKKEPFDPKFYMSDENEVEFIKYFEKEIRDSFEYKFLIDLFKNVLNIKECVFFKEFSIDNNMRLEFHHHPFTLFDYTQAVVRRQMEQHHGWILENDVERETTMLHYKLMVGLVPLDPTAHAQVHDGKLDIHPDLIIGNYEKFFKEYNRWIPETTKLKYQIYKETYPKNSELVYPENFKYKPTIIKASNKRLITVEKINQILIADKMSNINNDYITKMLEETK